MHTGILAGIILAAVVLVSSETSTGATGACPVSYKCLEDESQGEQLFPFHPLLRFNTT